MTKNKINDNISKMSISFGGGTKNSITLIFSNLKYILKDKKLKQSY